MPELGIRYTPFIETIYQFSDKNRTRGNRSGQDGRLRAEDIHKLSEMFNQAILGYGKERVVIPYPGDNKKVIGIDYRYDLTPEDAKLTYYTHRIFEAIFPHNFPHIHAVFGWPIDRKLVVSGTIRQRVEPIPEPDHIKYPFSKVSDFIDAGFAPVDYEEGNTLYSSEGGEYFADILEVNPGGRWWRAEIINSVLDNPDLNDKRKRIATTNWSLQRLSTLGLIELGNC